MKVEPFSKRAGYCRHRTDSGGLDRSSMEALARGHALNCGTNRICCWVATEYLKKKKDEGGPRNGSFSGLISDATTKNGEQKHLEEWV